MKTVTVQVSDKDYNDMKTHFTKPFDRQMGSPLVAVLDVLEDDNEDVCEHGYTQGCRACDPDGR